MTDDGGHLTDILFRVYDVGWEMMIERWAPNHDSQAQDCVYV